MSKSEITITPLYLESKVTRYDDKGNFVASSTITQEPHGVVRLRVNKAREDK